MNCNKGGFDDLLSGKDPKPIRLTWEIEKAFRDAQIKLSEGIKIAKEIKPTKSEG